MEFFLSLIRWLIRHRLIELLAFLKAYSVISKIAILISKKIDNSSTHNVVCLGRPIFNEEIDELSRCSGKINYLIIPKIIFISIFKYHFHHIQFDHVNYHKDSRYALEKRAYRRFLNKFLACLVDSIKVDALMSANYVYVWQQELATVCVENNIPFIVLHKEGMTSPNKYKNLVDTYTNGKFIATKMLVYNENIRSALLNASIENLDSENIITVGVPRFDRYFNLTIRGKDLVFFSFYMRDKIRHIGLNKNQQSDLLDEAMKFHIEVMKFAQTYNQINVTIKTKSGGMYFDYVKNISEKYGFNNTKNLKIINTGATYDLIKSAAYVVGFNSSVLLEAMIAKRQIFIPIFSNGILEDYFAGNECLVSYVQYASDLKKCMNQGVDKAPNQQKEYNFLKEFISIPDGKSSVRAESEILSTVDN